MGVLCKKSMHFEPQSSAWLTAFPSFNLHSSSSRQPPLLLEHLPIQSLSESGWGSGGLQPTPPQTLSHTFAESEEQGCLGREECLPSSAEVPK